MTLAVVMWKSCCEAEERLGSYRAYLVGLFQVYDTTTTTTTKNNNNNNNHKLWRNFESGGTHNASEASTRARIAREGDVTPN